jgi:hypothetical protein
MVYNIDVHTTSIEQEQQEQQDLYTV